MGFTYDLVISFVSILSIPIHVLLMVAMQKAKKFFSKGFYGIIMHLTVCHILITIVNVTVAFPSNYPVVRALLDENPTLNWIVGIIATNRGYSLKWVMEMFLAIIALNRLAAVMAPVAFHKQNDALVTVLCYTVWVVFVGIRLPVIWPLHLTVYHPVDDPDRTIYILQEKGYTTFCIWVGIIVGVTSLIITYLSYMVIVIKVFISHVFGNNKMKPQIKRSVIVACVSTFGLFLMCFTETAEEVYWRLWEVDFVQTDTYYLLVNIGLEYSIWSLPISMIGMFPEAPSSPATNRIISTIDMSSIFQLGGKIGKSRRVVLRQGGGGDAGARGNTVDVQVLRDNDGSRRNTIDLQFKEGRSRKNTLELKVNGEVVQPAVPAAPQPSPEPTDPSMNNNTNSPRTLSIVRSTNNSRPNTPNAENQRNNQVDNSARWAAFNPPRQFYILKGLFIILCLVDIIHWAYLLRDDSSTNPNSWRFYKKFESFDLHYLVARMFSDIFTCVLGLGAAMWTRKPLLTLPCTTIQLLFLIIRAVCWAVRSFNHGLDAVKATSEDKVFVICEFVIPLVWVLLSILIVRTTKRLRSYEQLHGYAHPPIIVLTVKNDDNDESVQIEIA